MAAFAMVFLAVGCQREPAEGGSSDVARSGGDGPMAATTTVRDSAGIRIVESAAPKWAAGDGWRLEEDPMTIGVLDGDAPFVFGWISDGAVGPDGMIAVIDAFAREVRMFDSAGAHLTTVGGPGNGPGEFMAVPTGGLRVVFTSADSILAWDNLRRRLIWFGVDGSYARQIDVGALVPGLPNTDFWGLLPDASLLLLESTAARGPSEIRFTESWSVLRPDANGYGKTTIGARTAERLARLPDGSAVWNPFRRLTSPVAGGDPLRIFVPDEDRWEVRVHDADGTLREIWRADVGRAPVTPEMVRRGREVLDSLGADQPAGLRGLAEYDALSFPDSVQAIASVHWDSDGYLWVAHLDPRYRVDMWEAFTDYEVFASTGEWLGHIAGGPTFLLDVGRGRVLSSSPGPMGVPVAEVHRILGATR